MLLEHGNALIDGAAESGRSAPQPYWCCLLAAGCTWPAAQGSPCGKVVDAREQGADDYLATCENGHRYRVFVNGDGRVVVEKLD